MEKERRERGEKREEGEREENRGNEEKRRKVRLTQRDIEAIEFLMRVKFATLEQLNRYLKGTSERALYLRLLKLKPFGLIETNKITVDSPLVISPGPKAKTVVDTDLPISKVVYTGFDHNLRVVDVFLQLLQQEYSKDSIITEAELTREVRAGQKIGEVRKTIHVPDLVVVKTEGDKQRKTAFEVELSLKAYERIRKKLEFYAKNRDYYSVVYICSATPLRIVQSEIEKQKLTHVKAISISELGGD